MIIRLGIPPCLEETFRTDTDGVFSLSPSALSDTFIICRIIDHTDIARVSVIAAGGNNSEDVKIAGLSPMFPLIMAKP